MLGRQDAIGVEEALLLINNSLSDYSPPVSEVPVEKASGRILAGDVFSPEDLPGFARSTVDGYAVRSSDTFGATENSPAYLKIAHEILMGDEPDFELISGEAAKIATGGMLPPGADSVVMLEHAQTAPGGMLEVQKPVAPTANVIEKGEDIGKGQQLLVRGRKLRPQDIAAFAGIGITRVSVYERPVVSIISTGDEIVPASQRLRPGLVRDMNSYNLAALLEGAGAEPAVMGIIGDDYDSLKSALSRAVAESSMVLITGGSSVGAKDMTAHVLSDLGQVLFHYVSVKPGKPTLFGLAGVKVPVFGLPGHPRAVAVCFEIFVKPALRHITGQRIHTAFDKYGRSVRAKLAKSIRSEIGKREYSSVSLDEIDGELRAVPLPGKSGLITMLVKGDGIVAVPAGSPGLQSGEIVEVKLL